jgi:hypothetical protein
VTAAELRIYHSHSPAATRRVAPQPFDPSRSGVLACQYLAAMVVGIELHRLDDDDRFALDGLFDGLQSRRRLPRALRHRVQDDKEGLDVSLHVLAATEAGWVAYVDQHGAPAPQVVGALVALEGLGEAERLGGLEVCRKVAAHAPESPGELRGLVEDLLGGPSTPTRHAVRTWALEILGIGAGTAEPTDREVMRAFRRRVREEHPDHGASHEGAAERLVALQRAKAVLLGLIEA